MPPFFGPGNGGGGGTGGLTFVDISGAPETLFDSGVIAGGSHPTGTFDISTSSLVTSGALYGFIGIEVITDNPFSGNILFANLDGWNFGPPSGVVVDIYTDILYGVYIPIASLQAYDINNTTATTNLQVIVFLDGYFTA